MVSAFSYGTESFKATVLIAVTGFLPSGESPGRKQPMTDIPVAPSGLVAAEPFMTTALVHANDFPHRDTFAQLL